LSIIGQIYRFCICKTKKGFTFLDEKEGFFMDLIIEVKDSEIINFMEFFNLINDVDVPNKKEQITIKPFKLDSDKDDVTF
jgi:hypothetical protein